MRILTVFTFSLLSLFLLILSLLFASNSSMAAPESQGGRLPDGRAFRTDTEGNQVVDYIAELEATVDSLTRQLATFEGAVEGRPKLEPVAISCPEKDCPPCENFNSNSISCDEPLKNLKASLESSFSRERLSSEREINEYRSEISRLKTLIDSNQNENARARFEPKTISADESSKQPSFPPQRVLVDPDGNWMNSPARVRAIEALKGTVVSEINRITTRSATRDKLLRAHNGSGLSPVSISQDLPETDSGKSLDELRAEVQSASSGRELSEIRGGVNEIKSKIEEDIALLTRLSRIR